MAAAMFPVYGFIRRFVADFVFVIINKNINFNEEDNSSAKRGNCVTNHWLPQRKPRKGRGGKIFRNQSGANGHYDLQRLCVPDTRH
jgi:hypothetical protein